MLIKRFLRYEIYGEHVDFSLLETLHIQGPREQINVSPYEQLHRTIECARRARYNRFNWLREVNPLTAGRVQRNCFHIDGFISKEYPCQSLAKPLK